MNRRDLLRAAAALPAAAIPAIAMPATCAVVWSGGLRKLDYSMGYAAWVRATGKNGSWSESSRFWPATRQPCTLEEMIAILVGDVRGLLSWAPIP